MARAKSFILKRRAELLLTVLGLSLVAWAARADTFIVNDLAGGLNDAIPGSLIADNEAVVASNVHVDPISRGLEQRRGSSKLNTSALTGSTAADPFSHTQSDGDSYLIVVSSRTVYSSTSNGATYTSLITTATLNAVWDGVSFVDDSFYMVNQNDGGYNFTGTQFIPAGSMPAGKFIQAYQNRLFVANTASFPYRVFFSGLLQPSTWTTTTDYFDMPESVTCVGEPFDGGLPIYTNNTTWMLRGTSPTDYYLQQISGQVGCADNRMVQNFEINGTEYQIFLSLGPNSSKTTYYGLLGSRLVDLGERVPVLMSGVSIFNSSSRTEEWNTASDFNAGTFDKTFADFTGDQVELSTNTDTDTTTADFTAGTTSNTSVISNSVYLSTNNTNVDNNGLESGTLGNADNWTESGTAEREEYFPRSGSWSMVIDANYYLKIRDVSDTLLATSSLYAPSGGYTQQTYSMASYVGRWIKIEFAQSSDANSYMRSDAFLCSGGTLSWYESLGEGVLSVLDDIEGARSTTFTGTFTGASFDTGFSTAVFLASNASWTTNGHAVSMQTQESSDGSSWDTAVSWSTGSAPSDGTRKRYKRYVVTISTGGTTNGTALPYVDDVTLYVRAATGTYTSDVRDAGTAISSWDIFSANTSGGNSQSFSYRTGATTTTLAAASYTSIASGSDISGSDRYIQWKSTFSIHTASDSPTIDTLTINFSESSGSSQPGDMEVWNNDLWMTYTSTTATTNTSIILMNNEGKFSTLTGLSMYGFCAHNKKLIGGTSVNNGTTGGYVYQLDTGSTDDGTAITASVVLKHHDFPGDNQDWRKVLSHVYFNYAVSLGTFTVTVNENYSDDEQSKTVTATSGNTVGRYRLEADPGTTAKQFGLEFTNSYPGARLTLYPPMTYYFSKQKMVPQ